MHAKSSITVSLSFVLFLGIILQILSTQGVFMFNFFKLFGNWELKMLVQPISFLILIFYFIFLRPTRMVKIQVSDILLFGYFTLTLIPLLINFESIKSTYIAFREVYLVYILIFLYNQLGLPKRYYSYVMNLIFLFVILNIYFTFLIYQIGWSDYTKLLVGEPFWSNHKIYNFKISNFMGTGIYRVPALVGEAAALGHFGFFSFLLLKNTKRYRYLSYLSLILVAACFVRSVYLITALYFLFTGISTSKKFQRFLLYSIPFIPVLLYFLIKGGLLSTKSLWMRLAFWDSKLDINYNFLWGGAIGKVGGALDSSEFVFSSVLDNYWLLMLYSIGIIGIILIIYFLFEKTNNNKELRIVMLSVLISGMFITLTQSMVILGLFPLLFLSNNKNNTALK